MVNGSKENRVRGSTGVSETMKAPFRLDDPTIQGLKKLKPDQRLRMGFEMTDMAVEILIAGIKAREPQIGSRELRDEMGRCLWDVPARVSGPSFRAS